MDEDGEAAAEEEVVAEQNDEVVVEATGEEQRRESQTQNDDQHANQVNLAMAYGSSLLNDKTLEMLVVLRMNRIFMAFMREKYFFEIKALHPLTWPLWLLISKRPKRDLKWHEFFAALRRHGQREGWIRNVRVGFVPVYSV
jgi:hypothetical protein